MLAELRLINFRSISNPRRLKLAPLNVLIGPNNAGKSSLLYALLLMKQTMSDANPDAALVTSLQGLELGGYRDLVHGHDENSQIGMELRFHEAAMPKFSMPGGSPQAKQAVDFSFRLGYDKKRNRILVSEAIVRAADAEVLLAAKRGPKGLEMSGVPADIGAHLGLRLVHFVPATYLKGKAPKDKQLATKAFRRMFDSIVYPMAAEEVLQNIRYIGPVRDRIPPMMLSGTRTYAEVGPTGADTMRVLASQERTGRGMKGEPKTAEARLREWLCDRFRTLKDVRLHWGDVHHTVVSLLGDERRGVADLNLAYMGFGIGQLVPLIVETGILPPQGCLLVEQPEVHLHPKAQADLADLFLAHLKGGRQFIIETHSEHLVLRLRRRIAEGLDPTNVRLFHFGKAATHTVIKAMDIDRDGMVPKWPRRFFEQSYEEALRIAEAGISKRAR